MDNNIVYAQAFWNQQQILCNGYITPVSGKGASNHFDAHSKDGYNRFFLYSKDSTDIWMNFGDTIYSFNTATRTYAPLLKTYEPKKIIEFLNGSSIVVAVRNIVLLQHNRSTELFRNDAFDFTTAEKVSEECLIVGSVQGLCYFYPAQRRLEPIPYKQHLKVRAIFKDRENRTWFTTYGQGMFYLAGRSIIPVPLDNAGYLSIAHSIEQDKEGNFWVSTNHGLFKLPYPSLLSIIRGKSNKLYYTYFDKTDGFNTNEFNGGCLPASLKQKETGLQFFPSMSGIVVFRPEDVQSIVSNKPLFFDEIILNDTGHLYSLPEQLVFDNRTTSMRIHFASPYYGHGTSIKYSYALSTAPEDWKDLGSTRSITLNNLPGGAYTVILKKEEAAGTPVVARLQFEIEKKFAETLLFKVLVLFGVAALVFLFFKARLRNLQKDRTRLEGEVVLRTAEQVKLIGQLKKTVTDLTQTQQELSEMIDHKESIMAVLIHDIKSPLRFLNNVADYMAENIGTNTPDKNNAIAKEMAQSLNRLYLFTQDFAVWMNASGPGVMQKWEATNLEDLLADVWKVYNDMAAQKGITIKQALHVKHLHCNAPLLKSVLRNLIDNAIKNTVAGCITITATGDDGTDSCLITITDEGRGMAEEEIAELNQYFDSGAPELSFSAMQFGHKIIRDFMQMLTGKIWYEQNTPAGVRVKVNLPLRTNADKSSN
jgi:signal transduction histidine kinase